LATASHELRTPLASLRGTVELLEEELARGAPDWGGIRRRAAAAHRQTDRMTALAEDLLDLGRLDGNAPLAGEPVELRELAGTLAAEIAPAAHAADVTVELVAPEAVWAVCDPRATARVLRALLENALRHGAPPGSAVTIVVDARGDRARLRVIDAGAGVPEAERERIFGRFERGGRAGPGFGLGLAIARGLARQMGGDVNAPAVPSGACFEATLPVGAAPVGAAQTTHQSTDAAPVSSATPA
ncbi:MAG: sensor histidine kinase, partial [Solirubrobacteraceae bacterium]